MYRRRLREEDFDSAEKAAEFRSRYGKPSDPIYRLEPADWFRADMSLLGGQTLVEASVKIHAYWQGRSIQELFTNSVPQWEYVLVPPILVADLVNV